MNQKIGLRIYGAFTLSVHTLYVGRYLILCTYLHIYATTQHIICKRSLMPCTQTFFLLHTDPRMWTSLHKIIKKLFFFI